MKFAVAVWSQLPVSSQPFTDVIGCWPVAKDVIRLVHDRRVELLQQLGERLQIACLRAAGPLHCLQAGCVRLLSDQPLRLWRIPDVGCDNVRVAVDATCRRPGEPFASAEVATGDNRRSMRHTHCPSRAQAAPPGQSQLPPSSSPRLATLGPPGTSPCRL